MAKKDATEAGEATAAPKHSITITFEGEDIAAYEKLAASAKKDRRPLTTQTLMFILAAITEEEFPNV